MQQSGKRLQLYLSINTTQDAQILGVNDNIRTVVAAITRLTDCPDLKTVHSQQMHFGYLSAFD